MKAVILAGGKGTRLAPYTKILPKPLMPIGDMPILEVLLRQMKKAGVDEVILTVGHLAHLLQTFFQDGSQYGLKIHYSYEEKPLGTAGPLAPLADLLDDTFLVANGDVLTTLVSARSGCCSPAIPGRCHNCLARQANKSRSWGIAIQWLR